MTKTHSRTIEQQKLLGQYKEGEVQSIKSPKLIKKKLCKGRPINSEKQINEKLVFSMDLMEVSNVAGQISESLEAFQF